MGHMAFGSITPSLLNTIFLGKSAVMPSDRCILGCDRRGVNKRSLEMMALPLRTFTKKQLSGSNRVCGQQIDSGFVPLEGQSVSQ